MSGWLILKGKKKFFKLKADVLLYFEDVRSCFQSLVVILAVASYLPLSLCLSVCGHFLRAVRSLFLACSCN